MLADVRGRREALCCVQRRWPGSQAQALLPEDPALLLLEAIPYQCLALHCSCITAAAPVATSVSRVPVAAEKGGTCVLPAPVLAAPSGCWRHHQRHRAASPPTAVPILCASSGGSRDVPWGSSLFVAVHCPAQQGRSCVWTSAATAAMGMLNIRGWADSFISRMQERQKDSVSVESLCPVKLSS